MNNILADGSITNGTAATSTVVVTVTATPSASATSGTPAGSTASPACTDTSSSSALAVGLGAGLGVGVPLLIALATSLFFLQKTRKENRALKSGAHAPNYVSKEQEVPKAPVFENAGHPHGMPELGQQHPTTHV